MKNILLLIITAFAIVGCSNEEKGEKLENAIECLDDESGKVLSLDSIHYYSFKKKFTDNSYILKKREGMINLQCGKQM